MQEKKTFYLNGYLGIVLLILLGLFGAFLGFNGVVNENIGLIVAGALFLIIAYLFFTSLTIVAPNQAKVITFFGKYLGTIRANGLFITVPLTQKAMN